MADLSLAAMMRLARCCAECRGLIARKHWRVRKPIFIVGCPRSGTTVLAACLAQHSRLAGFDESLLLLDFATIFFDYHQGMNERSWAPLSHFASARDMLGDLGSLSDRIFGRALRKAGKGIYIDHTPSHVAVIPLLNALYPDACFIHVIRDGRDVVRPLTRSYLKGFTWAGNSLSERTRLWSMLAKTGRHWSPLLGERRYTELHYEQFCRNPRRALETVLRFLSLHCEDPVLAPLSVPHADPLRPDATLAVVRKTGDLIIKARRTGNRWPQEWTHAERLEFNRFGAAALEQFGYRVLPETGRPS